MKKEWSAGGELRTENQRNNMQSEQVENHIKTIVVICTFDSNVYDCKRVYATEVGA